MAHRRSTRGRGISDAQRRKKTWAAVKVVANGAGTAGDPDFLTAFVLETPAAGSAGESQSDVLALIDSGSSLGTGDELSTLPEESTILRMRGSLVFPKTDGTPTAGLGVTTQFALGIGVASIRAIVGGSSPLPISDADWDGWMFLRQSAVAPLDSVGTIVDVKSMRKLRGGDALFIAAETINQATGVSGQWTMDLRLLILLP